MFSLKYTKMQLFLLYCNFMCVRQQGCSYETVFYNQFFKLFYIIFFLIMNTVIRYLHNYTLICIPKTA